jgi:DNA modification methylase
MQFGLNTIIEGNSLDILKQIEDDSIDCIVTDPPYGYSFMNKDWDKAVVSVDIWKECLRVMKSGAFAFIMSSPRQDVLCKMILNLIDAGFETNFTSMYHSYASGFPKAANVSKLVDKRNGRTSQEHKQLGEYLKQKRIESKITTKELSKLFPSKTGGLTGCLWNWENGENVPTKQQYEILKQKLNLDNKFDELIEREEAEREIIGKDGRSAKESIFNIGIQKEWNITKSATEAAKRLDGSYAGFQPKPALEVIITVMKPLSEKSYVDQSLKNGKGITWLDNVRIPFNKETDEQPRIRADKKKNHNGNILNDNRTYGIYNSETDKTYFNEKGRFPANLIVSDDSLNDGKITGAGITGSGTVYNKNRKTEYFPHNVYGERKIPKTENSYNDSGSYSRYFDLDKWYDNRAQFIITPKASASERNKGLETNEGQKVNDGRKTEIDNPFQRGETIRQNSHPTVKPLKLMSYLITMGSRPNDIILDPFCGSGTTCIAALQLGRQYIGIEKEKEYCEIARNRLKPYQSQTNLLNF